MLFFSIAIVGVLIELILYRFVAPSVGVGTATVNWGFKSVEVLATLFIWQFGGYMAFEFPGEVRNYNKNKQIEAATFTFRFFD